MIRTVWSWLRLYGAAIQLEAAKKLLEVEQAMGADIEHILRAQARVNERRQAHVAIQTECGYAQV